MNVTVKDAGGPYWNKGHQCYWVKLHDGTTHKFIVQKLECATPTAPAEWIIDSDEQTKAVLKDLSAGLRLKEIQLKYGWHEEEDQ